jgi:glutathione peroxidase-family protein
LKKGVVSYFKSNGIIALKKHVNANHGQIFKMFEKVKSKHKSPLQKLLAKKQPTMNASVISKLLFGSIDLYKKDNVHQKQFVEILGLLVVKTHLPI